MGEAARDKYWFNDETAGMRSVLPAASEEWCRSEMRQVLRHGQDHAVELEDGLVAYDRIYEMGEPPAQLPGLAIARDVLTPILTKHLRLIPRVVSGWGAEYPCKNMEAFGGDECFTILCVWHKSGMARDIWLDDRTQGLEQGVAALHELGTLAPLIYVDYDAGILQSLDGGSGLLEQLTARAEAPDVKRAARDGHEEAQPRRQLKNRWWMFWRR